MTNKLQAAKQIFTADRFSVGSFVRHRDWTVPAAGECLPRVNRKSMRIVGQYESYGKTVFLCGGGREFEAFELVPAE